MFLQSYFPYDILKFFNAAIEFEKVLFKHLYFNNYATRIYDFLNGVSIDINLILIIIFLEIAQAA